MNPEVVGVGGISSNRKMASDVSIQGSVIGDGQQSGEWRTP